VYWPGGVRHRGDVSLVCCSRTERGKACPDTAALVWRGERECPEWLQPRGIEYRCVDAPADRLVVVVNLVNMNAGSEKGKDGDLVDCGAA
jgi:hypothetical protein